MVAIKESDMSEVEIVCPSNEVELEGVIEEAGELVDRFWVIVLQKIA